MTGYYRAKRELEREEAKRYLDAREVEKAIAGRKEINERDSAWLARYRASGRARTGFDWRPRWPLKPPGETNGKEIIEGEFAVMADADAQGERSGEAGILAQGKITAGGSGEAPQGNAQQDEADFETPF